MGWMERIKDFSYSIWNNQNIQKKAAAGAQLVQETSNGLLELVKAAPKAAYSLVKNMESRQVARHAGTVVIYDYLPYIGMYWLNQQLQAWGAEEENSNQSAYFALCTAQTITQIMSQILKTRFQLGFAIHSSLLIMETVNASKNVNKNEHTICNEKACTRMRFVKGSFRDIIAYWLTEFGIEAIDYVPYVGFYLKPLKLLLKIHHGGRYVLTLVTPEMCNSHQMEYLENHQALALSLGLSQAGMSALIKYGVEHYSGIPYLYYSPLVDKLVLVSQIYLAAHMKHPHFKADPQQREQTLYAIPDFISIYQNCIGFLFEIILLGLKRKIPQMLKEQGSSFNFENVAYIAGQLYDNPATQKLLLILLPTLLQDLEHLQKDELFAVNFDKLINNIISIIETIEKKKDKWYVNLAQNTLGANKTALALWMLLGTPKLLSKLIFKLLQEPQCIEFLRRIHAKLREMQQHRNAIQPLLPDATPLRTERSESLSQSNSGSSHEASDDQQESISPIVRLAYSTTPNKLIKDENQDQDEERIERINQRGPKKHVPDLMSERIYRQGFKSHKPTPTFFPIERKKKKNQEDIAVVAKEATP